MFALYSEYLMLKNRIKKCLQYLSFCVLCVWVNNSGIIENKWQDGENKQGNNCYACQLPSWFKL